MGRSNPFIIISLFWLIPLLLSLLGFFLSLWIILPAPTFTLLPLGVAAPEISPWLIIINLTAFTLAICVRRIRLSRFILITSLFALLLSLLPLSQLPLTNKQFAAAIATNLGKDYFQDIPQDLENQLRRQPFSFKDFFLGIPIGSVQIQTDIIFASPDGIDLKLNLYRPQQTGAYPTLIIIYGGAWQSGSPSHHQAFSRYIAALGYTAIAIDYRHAPEYKFPTQLEDVRTALNYIRDRADFLGVDPNRVALMGRSAGGHLASLVAYQQTKLPIKALINYYGPVDLTQGYYDPPFPDPIDSKNVLTKFLGGTPKEFPKLYHQASPINYVRPFLPPSLLVYAGRDNLVEAKFGQRLDRKLKANGNLSIFLEIPWAQHAFDTIFSGTSNQLALYYTERFLWSTLKSDRAQN